MKRLGFVLLLAAMGASSAPVATAAQRGGGGHGMSQGQGQGQRKPPSPPAARPTPDQTPAVGPDINRPSFVLEGLNRPSMPPAGPVGITPPTRSPFDAGRRTFMRRSTGIPFGGYGFGYYGGGTGYADNHAAVAEPPAIDESAAGALFLDAMPRDAQVFVDSAYVGTVDDVYSNGVRLSRGHHWLELESAGYDKKLVEINISPGQPLRYRVDLSPTRRAALTVIPARPPETMYAIPGCYGGNKPPVASALPVGCQMANLRVIKPQRTN